MKKIILILVFIILVIFITGSILWPNAIPNKYQVISGERLKNNIQKTDLCKNIENRVSKRACYIDEAIKSNNPELCNMLPYTKEEFNEITSGPIYQHSDITDCYRKIAISLNKPEICNLIDDFDKPLGTILEDCKSSVSKQ